MEAYEQLEKDQEKELAAGEHIFVRSSSSLGFAVKVETKTTVGKTVRKRGAADGWVRATREEPRKGAHSR
jgi:hypothetical protein